VKNSSVGLDATALAGVQSSSIRIRLSRISAYSLALFQAVAPHLAMQPPASAMHRESKAGAKQEKVPLTA